MALKPAKPTVPPAPSRANPGIDFSDKADAFASFQAPFADYMDGIATFTDERADEALAAAIGGTLPAITGKAGNYLRVNAGGTAAEFRTAAQVRADIGATAVGQAVFTAGSAADARTAIAAPALPTLAAGPGQVSIINPAVGAAAVLPSGGTWMYSLVLYNSGSAANFTAGVAAGGATVGTSVSGQNWGGFAWRVA